MLTRKEFLQSGVSTLLVTALMQGAAKASAAPLNGKVTAALPARDTIWAWEQQLGGWAPCFTGNANHQKWTDWLGAQLEVAGVKAQKKSFGIPLWDPKKWTLAIGGKDIPTASYRPYSGKTGPEGITAKMVYAGTMPNLDLSQARGKIVLVDAPAPGNYSVESHGTDLSAPLYQVKVPDLDALKAAGAIAAVNIWNGISDGDAADQALPFNAAPGDVPTIWVGEKAGQTLKAEAARGSDLTFTLYAEIHPDATSDNVWGILPGMTDDIVILNTHNDGCNAIEENGGLAVVALAQALAKIPKEQRQKTYIFFMSTGHFAHGYHRGSTDWMKEHPDYLKRAIACMTMEHLGATEWADKDGAYTPSGRIQRSDCFVPTAPMQAVYGAACQDAHLDRTTPIPNRFAFTGEDSQFSTAGIPSIGYIVLPNYFTTAAKGGEVPRLNKDRLYAEIQTFARCVEQLDALPRAQAYQGMEALATVGTDRFAPIVRAW